MNIVTTLRALIRVLRIGAASTQRLRLLGLLCFPGLSAAGTIDTASQAPYEQCGYCHEYDGNSVMAQYPKLSGLPEEYIVKQLQDFRSGRRDGKGMMQEAARLLSEAEIEVVSSYFSRQKRTYSDRQSNGNVNRLGKKLVERGRPDAGIPACLACHGGQQPIPSLFGQHAEYLRAQLRAFKAGSRGNDTGELMRRIASSMSTTEIDSVSEYLTTQRAGQ